MQRAVLGDRLIKKNKCPKQNINILSVRSKAIKWIPSRTGSLHSTSLKSYMEGTNQNIDIATYGRVQLKIILVFTTKAWPLP